MFPVAVKQFKQADLFDIAVDVGNRHSATEHLDNIHSTVTDFAVDNEKKASIWEMSNGDWISVLYEPGLS